MSTGLSAFLTSRVDHQCSSDLRSSSFGVACVVEFTQGALQLHWEISYTVEEKAGGGTVRVIEGSAIRYCPWCGLDFGQVNRGLLDILKPDFFEAHPDPETAVAAIVSATNLPRKDAEDMLLALINVPKLSL